MVTRKSRAEIERMRRAGRIVAEVLDKIEAELRPGVSTAHLDQIAEAHIRESGAIPSFLGYPGINPRRPFPSSVCISIDDEIVHGIPGNRTIRSGQIVSVDAGAIVEGWHADAAVTVPVGEVSAQAAKLIAVTDEALRRAIAAAVVGKRLGDIGAAVQRFVEAQGFSIVRNYVGHGIGRAMHEEPQVPNYGAPERGLQIKEGLCIAIEPMVNIGGPQTRTLPDQWTVVTADGSLSAHFEHTLWCTAAGPVVLTAPEGQAAAAA